MRDFQVCSNCVMDTSDSQISFDDHGVCDHCRGFQSDVAPNWNPEINNEAELMQIAEQIRADRKGRDFDCILGMSGGFDSSYMLHIAVTKMKLRPLVFHVDGGWNTRIAVQNIENVVEKLGLDLFTEVIDWEEMKDLQLAFFKSGVPHIDIPQDMAFIATLYKFAAKHNIKYILNGYNLSTECVRNPLDWMYYGTDLRQFWDIQKQFGTSHLKNYPISSIFYHKIYLNYIRRIKVIKPLNMIPYNKAAAGAMMTQEYGWEMYPQKHFESRFTRFYEGYWLPTRFGFDTRKVQFSSLILTGQMTREEALQRLQEPAIAPDQVMHELDFIAKKLGISTEELIGYRDMPLKSYKDYKNQQSLFNAGAKVLKAIGVEKSIKR